MIIRDMFKDDINRKVNGVIKVDQDSADVIDQEVREYVITKTSLDKGTQRKTTENELPSLTQCTA